MAKVSAPTILPFLWFNDQAEQAARFYVSIFPGSKVLSASGMSVTFQLGGQTIMALNGGPHYRLTPAFSLFVSCKDQAEVDHYWEALLEGGGHPSRCGWLTDRFGLSWQVIPEALGQLLGDKDPARADRAMQAMMGMVKLDVQGLRDAADGKSTGARPASPAKKSAKKR